MTPPFRLHVVVCTQEKPDRTPCCAAVGGRHLFEKVQNAVAGSEMAADVLVTGSSCFGTCERGPNMIVYPEGRWYTEVEEDEALEIIRAHHDRRTPQARRDPDPATIRAEVLEHRQKYRRATAARAAAGMLPEEVDALFRAFQPSRVLLTAIELDIFSAIAAAGDSGAMAGDVARRTRASDRGVEPLLHALVSLGLLVKAGGRFYNGPVANDCLREGALHDARAALMHTVHLWGRWGALTECVRKGEPAEHTAMAARDPAWTEAFIAAMHRNATARAPIVVGALDLTRVRRVLDLGGGSGAYAAAFARAKPDLVATVFDLPNVTPLTQRYVDASGVGGRVRTVDGDLHTDTYGEGFDLVFVSAICHMNGPEENRSMFRKIRAALAPGGQVVVQDFVLDDDKTGPRTGALFALNMLVGTRHGSAYSGAEYCTWLSDTGFESAHMVPLPGPTDLVVAVHP
jgi:(2Fe-2S) ferredoxin/SAM-dependent methyltransferase